MELVPKALYDVGPYYEKKENPQTTLSTIVRFLRRNMLQSIKDMKILGPKATTNAQPDHTLQCHSVGRYHSIH